ncbi:thioesterase II family protein [Actinophytocola sp.]|uniref:thioesterase II family protein n=1 Tax=Actinophytocola sp. TaxID=1872138 RepID=UPI00389A7DDA
MTRPDAPTRSPWFPFRAKQGDAEIRLFCLPPAAGAASGYRSWTTRLAPRVEVVPVQLPGRESRFVEDPLTSAGELVARLVDAVGPETGARYAVFGHSMGALLAYDLACALAAAGRPPAHLVVSAHVPAHLMALKPRPTHVARMSDEELRDYLAGNGGLAGELLRDEEVLAILLPLLRADLSVCESYRWTPRPPLEVPITALGGEHDPNAPGALLRRWSELTSAGFRCRLLPGGHHYLYDDPAAAAGAVSETLLDPPEPSR